MKCDRCCCWREHHQHQNTHTHTHCHCLEFIHRCWLVNSTLRLPRKWKTEKEGNKLTARCAAVPKVFLFFPFSLSVANVCRHLLAPMQADDAVLSSEQCISLFIFFKCLHAHKQAHINLKVDAMTKLYRKNKKIIVCFTWAKSSSILFGLHGF